MGSPHAAVAARCRAVIECPHASKELRDAAQRLLRPAPAAQPTLAFSAAPAADASTWTCRTCATVNQHAGAFSCSACGETRALAPGVAWPCVKCTFYNRAQRSKCEVCCEPRPTALAEAERRAQKRRRNESVAAAMADGDDDFA
jgi:hypothetical protein